MKNKYLNILNQNLKQYFSLSTLKLSFYDFSKLYKGSFLGIFWAFFKPFFAALVFYLGNVAIYGNNFGIVSSGFPSWMPLILGMIVWQYLSDGIGSTPSVVREYSFMVTKMHFKKGRIYFFTNISKFFQHLVLMFIFFIIYLIIALVNNVDIQITLIQLPLIAIFMIIFFICWTMFIAPLCVISSDIKELVALFVMCAFWVSGTFFDPNNLITEKSSTLQKIIYQIVCINPLATFISIFKASYFGWIQPDAILIDGSTFTSGPVWFFEGSFSDSFFIGYWYKFIWVGIWCVIFVLIGLLINKKTKNWINDLL